MSFVHSKLHTKSKNQTFLKAGHLDSASLHLDDFAFIFVKWSLQMLRIFSVICRQMYVRLKNQLRKQASSAASSSVLPFYSLFGQALDRLVTVSSMCCHTSTSALSTSSSLRGLSLFRVWISHLEGGFTLRCLQRLSLPVLATRPCHWHDNRSTSGRSIPVLSY